MGSDRRRLDENDAALCALAGGIDTDEHEDWTDLACWTKIPDLPSGDYCGSNSLCEATGGPISIVGAIAGQCDCDGIYTWTNTDGVETSVKMCDELDGGVTCCGSIDNAGGVILYFLVVLYSFLAIAIICDEYFCESLDMISNALRSEKNRPSFLLQ
jgi:hypothetical protein